MPNTKQEWIDAYNLMASRVNALERAMSEFKQWLVFQNEALTKSIGRMNCEYNDGIMYCLGQVERTFNYYFKTEIKPIDNYEDKVKQFRIIKGDK